MDTNGQISYGAVISGRSNRIDKDLPCFLLDFDPAESAPPPPRSASRSGWATWFWGISTQNAYFGGLVKNFGGLFAPQLDPPSSSGDGGHKALISIIVEECLTTRDVFHKTNPSFLSTSQIGVSSHCHPNRMDAHEQTPWFAVLGKHEWSMRSSRIYNKLNTCQRAAQPKEYLRRDTSRGVKGGVAISSWHQVFLSFSLVMIAIIRCSDF